MRRTRLGWRSPVHLHPHHSRDASVTFHLSIQSPAKGPSEAIFSRHILYLQMVNEWVRKNQGIPQLYEMLVITTTMIIFIFLLWVKVQNKSPSYLTEYQASLVTRLWVCNITQAISFSYSGTWIYELFGCPFLPLLAEYRISLWREELRVLKLSFSPRSTKMNFPWQTVYFANEFKWFIECWKIASWNVFLNTLLYKLSSHIWCFPGKQLKTRGSGSLQQG